MGLRDRAREKQEQRMNDAFNVPEDQAYVAVTTLTWPDVERICNSAAKRGWRLHTLRDGLRGGDGLTGDNGYRMLFERDQIATIAGVIDGLGPT